jgi:hypothetical protein
MPAPVADRGAEAQLAEEPQAARAAWSEVAEVEASSVSAVWAAAEAPSVSAVWAEVEASSVSAVWAAAGARSAELAVRVAPRCVSPAAVLRPLRMYTAAQPAASRVRNRGP